MKPQKLSISFADYQRLYRVIVTVLNGVEAHTANACMFFSIAGAHILSSVHGLNSRPLCGSAFFRIDDATDCVMAFTDMNEFAKDGVESHSEAFHACIECDGVVIDLMAPVFRENFLSRQPTSPVRIPRKMFQKPKSLMAESPFHLRREGDFYLKANAALTNELIESFRGKFSNSDLVGICKHWYKPTPTPIQPKLVMGSDDGIQRLMILDKTELVGKW